MCESFCLAQTPTVLVVAPMAESVLMELVSVFTRTLDTAAWMSYVRHMYNTLMSTGMYILCVLYVRTYVHTQICIRCRGHSLPVYILYVRSSRQTLASQLIPLFIVFLLYCITQLCLVFSTQLVCFSVVYVCPP